MFGLAWSLGQAASDPVGMPMPETSDVLSTAFYAVLILVLAVVVGMVALAVRKKLLQPEEADASVGLGFTLSDLREMHMAGEIDDAEFSRAKAKMLAHARAQLSDEEDDLVEGELHLEGEADPNANDDQAQDDGEDLPR